MPVPRKNKSMKKSSKSSKRSKNVRKGKKTRKHMKNMRGGGKELNIGVNQCVDFIFKCGNEVLLSRNPNVTNNNNNNNWAFIGTYATSGSEDGNTQASDIKKGIDNYNKTGQGLLPVESSTAKILLKKDLGKFMTVTNDIEKIINGMTRVNEKGTFHDVIDDIRLSDGHCLAGECEIKTELFKIIVEPKNKDLFKNARMWWKKYTDISFFTGHKKILNDVWDKL